MARNPSFKLIAISALAGVGFQGAAQAADVTPDNGAGPAVRFLVESQSGYSFLSGRALDSEEEDLLFHDRRSGAHQHRSRDILNIQGEYFSETMPGLMMMQMTATKASSAAVCISMGAATWGLWVCLAPWEMSQLGMTAVPLTAG